MHDTAAHVQMVKKRIHQRQRTQEKRSIYGLSTICILLSVLLVGMTGWFSGFEPMVHIAMYGSMLLHEDAGGYVLVGGDRLYRCGHHYSTMYSLCGKKQRRTT